MIQVKCTSVELKLPFNELLPFQGALKTRTEEDITSLSKSLREDGMLMPFVIWHKPEAPTLHYLLDGHARYEAVHLLAVEEPELLAQQFPVIIVEAVNIAEAKNALLQISSTYGKITPKGLKIFLGDVTIAVPKGIRVRLPTVKAHVPESTTAVMRLSVPKDKVKDLTELLASVSYITIL